MYIHAFIIHPNLNKSAKCDLRRFMDPAHKGGELVINLRLSFLQQTFWPPDKSSSDLLESIVDRCLA